MKKPLWHQIVKAVGYLDSVTGNRLLLSMLNNQFKELGVMTSIVIDSKSKSIAILVELKGEDKPIGIKIQDYSVETNGTGSLVKFGDISFSREWMDAVARNFLTDRTLAIPVPADLLEQIL